MARQSIVLKLTEITQPLPQVVEVLEAGNKWSTKSGNWLIPGGVWNQLPSGLYLMDPTNKTQIAICLGCIFLTCKKGDSGQAQYPSIGGVGKWTVEATTP